MIRKLHVYSCRCVLCQLLLYRLTQHQGNAIKISAREVVKGKVSNVVNGPVREVTIEVAPGIQMVSVISNTSAKNFRPGERERPLRRHQGVQRDDRYGVVV